MRQSIELVFLLLPAVLSGLVLPELALYYPVLLGEYVDEVLQAPDLLLQILDLFQVVVCFVG